MTQLEESIAKIGGEMIECNRHCHGVACDQANGILPRCLILESHPGKNGCAIVGINPGRARSREVRFYKEHGATYQTVVQYWNSDTKNFRYYKKLRELVVAFGIDGPLLWTELAKCENSAETKFPPLRALRTCTGNFLNKELQEIPQEWPLFAVGKEVYQALAYSYPKRTIIGVPHPTGAYGDAFSRHTSSGRMHSASKEKVATALSKPAGELLWLND